MWRAPTRDDRDEERRPQRPDSRDSRTSRDSRNSREDKHDSDHKSRGFPAQVQKERMIVLLCEASATGCTASISTFLQLSFVVTLSDPSLVPS